MAFPKRQIAFFLVCLSVSAMASSSARNDVTPVPPNNVQGLIKEMKTVAIVNGLGKGLTLKYHCRSKDDDLGYRTMGPREAWSFQFRPNIFGTTLFFCRFWWSGNSKVHWFDIFRSSRDDEESPCTVCWWRITRFGPCKFNDGVREYDLCYEWDKKI